MKEREIRSLIDSFPRGIRATFVDYSADMIFDNATLEKIAFGYIATVLEMSYYSFKDVVSGDMTKGDVYKVYPEILDQQDEDGLLKVDDSLRLLNFGIEYKNHILYYHQFFRRGYKANPNLNFLSSFIQYYSMTKNRNTFKIAIDHNRLMPKEFVTHIGEFDQWFGPRFNINEIDNPDTIGTTIIKREKPSCFDLFTNRLDRTEFYWSYSNEEEIKTFEVEEISDNDFFFSPYYLNKYLHSQRDVKNKVLQHCDGAIKVYLQDSYKERLSSHIPKEPKCFKKIKLFRIDGNIELDTWISLVSYFYRGNEMIVQYFDPEQFELIYGKEIKKWEEVFNNHKA